MLGTLVVWVSFTSTLTFYIHNFGERKNAKVINFLVFIFIKTWALVSPNGRFFATEYQLLLQFTEKKGHIDQPRRLFFSNSSRFDFFLIIFTIIDRGHHITSIETSYVNFKHICCWKKLKKYFTNLHFYFGNLDLLSFFFSQNEKVKW